MIYHRFSASLDTYCGSGEARMVLQEAGLDGESQFKAVVRYVREKR